MDLPPRRPQAAPLSSINVTPLVDVMLVLLIVFLVTASLGQQALVVLPQAAAPTVQEPEGWTTVTIEAGGRILVGSQPVDEASLTRSLSTKKVLLKADQALPYGVFVRVVARIQAAGVEQLGMVTAPPKD